MGGTLCAVTESVGETKPITVKYFQLREIVICGPEYNLRSRIKKILEENTGSSNH